MDESRKVSIPGWVYPLVLLVISVVVFWILPTQMPQKPVQIEFSDSSR
jgi:hypothetical protein